MSKKNAIPPYFANRLLSWFIRDELREEVEGDLWERFQEVVRTKSLFRAKMDYWYQVLNYIRPFALGKSILTIDFGMHKSHVKVGWRNLFRQKWNSFINIGGLSLGMGICLVICQYVLFEVDHDRFHPDYDRIYRIIIKEAQDGVPSGSGPYATYKLGEKAEEVIPEVEQYVRFYPSEYSAVITNPETEQRFNEDGHTMAFADSTFLRMFNFPLKRGDPTTALNGIHNIVITEKMAKKYFGHEDPMGKTLVVKGGSSYGSCTITGVLEDLPLNNHLQFAFLRPLENLWKLGNGGSVNRYGGWAREWFGTYLKIKESADITSVQEKLDQLIKENKLKGVDPENVVETTKLQPIADIHLRSGAYSYPDYAVDKGNLSDIQIFVIIAFFILFIGWVNYINLSTAQSMGRAKEVGIRKSIGALKRQLVVQFITESVLVNLISGLLAIGIALVLLPVLGHSIGKELYFTVLGTTAFWYWFFVFILGGALLSGLYPAFVLSSYRPISMLGSTKMVRAGSMQLRKGLIVFQFLISIALVSGTYLVYKQITYMKARELGMDIEKMLVVIGPKFLLNGPKVTDGTDMVQIRAANAYSRARFLAFQEEVANHHSIGTVTGSRLVPGQVQDISNVYLKIWGAPEGEAQQFWLINTGMHFIKTYGLKLLAGNTFNSDMSDDNFVLLNEEAVKTFGFDSPQDAVQQKITFGEKPITVVGVVKNFNWESLKSPFMPMVLRFDGGANNYISFRLGVADLEESLDHIKSVYRTIYPENAFDYFFLDTNFNRQYLADVQFGTLFLAFSILAIFLACIGLFALVSYSAVLRTKEIGIRKVHGASTTKITVLLSKEYLYLLLMAITVAIPLIGYWGNLWLENFAFRTSLGIDHFLIPVLVILIIALFTVGHKTLRSAQSNPVDSLKTD
ncbi:ABC transporter permease [Flavobacteriaceae bacterium GF1]